MNYKKSKFCVLRKNNEALILTNLKTGNIVKFESNDVGNVIGVLDKPNDHSCEQIKKFLVEKEFLVETLLDEDRLEAELISDIKNNHGKLSLIIMPTDDCNFRCPYCYEDHEKRSMSKLYLDKIALFVDKNIDNFNGLQVEWFGGEPLIELASIYYLSEKFIDICKKHKKPYVANMTTNGYFLTREVFLKLKRLHCLGYQITVDGFAFSHDKQRIMADGTGSWGTIINNLRSIKETPCRGFSNITIRTNFTSEMLDSGTEFIDFLCEEFGNDRRFTFYIRTVENFGGTRIAQMQQQFVSDRNRIRELLKYASSKGMRLVVNQLGLRAGGMICYANKSNYYILASDEIVRMSTCEYKNPINFLGYISSSGDLLIDKEKERMWMSGYQCENDKCTNRITCGGDGCPRNHLIHGQKSCIWNAGSIENTIDVLSYNTNIVETYVGGKE